MTHHNNVDDVDTVLAELNRHGVPTFVPLGNYLNAGVRPCFIQDNNGNLIEFVLSTGQKA